MKSYPNKRDCEHGQLRRSCPTCAADADYAALRARHTALREAVAWERECQSFTYRNPLSIDAMKEILRTRYAARAEVDRLLEDES